MTGTEFILWGILNFWLIVIGTVGVAFVITCLVNIHELFDELKTNKPPQVSKQELINDDDDDSIEMRAMKTDTDPWCACDNPTSSCDGTRLGCRHMSPRCRSITGSVNDDYCDWCRREQALLARLEETSP